MWGHIFKTVGIMDGICIAVGGYYVEIYTHTL